MYTGFSSSKNANRKQRQNHSHKNMVENSFILALLSFPFPALSSLIFTPTAQTKSLSKVGPVEIELPNFEELFDTLKEVSPLAKLVVEGKHGGFSAVKDKRKSILKWKTIESNSKRTVHHIDKVDNFQQKGCPLIRFRSSLVGPCVPEMFAKLMMTFEERKKWDSQIAAVDELFIAEDLSDVNSSIGHEYGHCSMLGVGFCATKPNLVVDSREQLTLCGTHEFQDGAAVLWGKELDHRYDILFPPGDRHTRAQSHLFCTALMPTGPNSFDAEYILQMEIGGMIPTFLTTPVLVGTVKSLFGYAKDFFGGDGGEIAKYISEQGKDITASPSDNVLTVSMLPIQVLRPHERGILIPE